MQLNLIDAGYIIEAKELEIFKSDFLLKKEKDFVKTETGYRVPSRVAELAELLAKGTNTYCYI